MISINQLTVHFGGFELFNNVSFLINQRDRIGLAGRNGAGKTTLLKIIAGEQKTEKGQVSIPNDITIGYLPQQMIIEDKRTVYEETISSFSEILQIEKDIKDINNEISNRIDYESESYIKLFNKLNEKNERFQIIGGANIHASVEKILAGLGFLKSDFSRQTSEFSGGWRMRIELAKILLKKPNILLLDEPTNHLDIESIQWLEELLKDYKGAVMLVAHDRKFLDTVTARTIEISLGKTFDYKVPYSKFVELRKERRQQQLSAYRNQQKMIDETEKFIKRFRYKATKAVQVQSKIKQLAKLERIEIEEEDTLTMHFKFPPAPHSGTIVVETMDLSKSYDELLVLKNVNLIIEKGEKVCFVGKNGEGKTTLSKVIIGELQHEGVLKIGHNVKIGYYAQNQAELLDDNKTVLQTIDDEAVGEIRTKVRDILGSFLFSGDDVDKKVSVLSGGERSRLSLALMLLKPVNLLVLDEPTNHLDIRSKDILKQALLKFNGTLIIVSHDRDFLNGLTDKVYEFTNKNVKENICSIYDFIKKKKISSLIELERKGKTNKLLKSKQSTENKLSYLEKKEFDKVLRKISNKISKSEKEITRLEKEISEIDELLSNPEKLNKLQADNVFYSKYENLKKELNEEMKNWEKLNLEYENLQ
ncbi:MAG: ABC-F family ATP-binding cassette domain-containing protein [Bacteroidales bacterium]|nr:ABC-F family ATP-binding cassette domain-containing protein [Bacteroidales bacterium]